MAGELQFECAVCRVQMKEANHWLMSWTQDGQICFAHFDGHKALEEHVICLCGEAHCHTILSQQLSAITGLKREDDTEEIVMEREQQS